MLFHQSNKSLRLIVVSTGRAGSVSLAKELTLNGIPCSHEKYFTPFGVCYKNSNSIVAHNEGLGDRKCYVAESSYMSLPYLTEPIAKFAKLIHLVRNPIKVVLSFHNDLRMFHKTSDKKKYEKFIEKHLPIVNEYNNSLEKCIAFVIFWNREIEKSIKNRDFIRVKIEDNYSPKLASFLSIKNYKKLEDTKVNSFERWDAKSIMNKASEEDIYNSKLGNEVKELEEDYGYKS